MMSLVEIFHGYKGSSGQLSIMSATLCLSIILYSILPNSFCKIEWTTINIYHHKAFYSSREQESFLNTTCTHKQSTTILNPLFPTFRITFCTCRKFLKFFSIIIVGFFVVMSQWSQKIVVWKEDVREIQEVNYIILVYRYCKA